MTRKTDALRELADAVEQYEAVQYYVQQHAGLVKEAKVKVTWDVRTRWAGYKPGTAGVQQPFTTCNIRRGCIPRPELGVQML